MLDFGLVLASGHGGAAVAVLNFEVDTPHDAVGVPHDMHRAGLLGELAVWWLYVTGVWLCCQNLILEIGHPRNL